MSTIINRDATMIKKLIYIFFVVIFTLVITKPVSAIDSLTFYGKKFIYQLSSNETHSFTPSWQEKISIIYATDVQNEAGI